MIGKERLDAMCTVVRGFVIILRQGKPQWLLNEEVP